MSERWYPLPTPLVLHAPGDAFAPNELRQACRVAGEGLGRADAREPRFRSAAEMVEMWRGLDLPAWVAPYVSRDARLGYLTGYGKYSSPESFRKTRHTRPPKRAGAKPGRRSSRRPVVGTPRVDVRK